MCQRCVADAAIAIASLSDLQKQFRNHFTLYTSLHLPLSPAPIYFCRISSSTSSFLSSMLKLEYRLYEFSRLLLPPPPPPLRLHWGSGLWNWRKFLQDTAGSLTTPLPHNTHRSGRTRRAGRVLACDRSHVRLCAASLTHTIQSRFPCGHVIEIMVASLQITFVFNLSFIF